MNIQLTPFAALSPDIIFNALDAIGISCDGRMLALNSYENRVYQVGVADGSSMVVKFYRPERWSDSAIIEEHQFVQELFDSEIPVVPAIAFEHGKTLHFMEGFRYAVFPKQGGRVPELTSFKKLAWMGRLLGRIHAIGSLQPFKARPTLDIQNFGYSSLEYLQNSQCLPREWVEPYDKIAKEALTYVEASFERAGSVKSIRLHGDCYPGNVLWTDDGPHFVDFDDARMGPAIQDLWMLLSGDRSEMAVQLGHLVGGYRMFCGFDSRELHLLEALRTLRLIHYSTWLAKRWDDPAFPAAFPWFTAPNYWQNRITELQNQISLMMEPPLKMSLFDD